VHGFNSNTINIEKVHEFMSNEMFVDGDWRLLYRSRSRSAC